MNIHILPTDKPSRLILQTNNKFRLSAIKFSGKIASGVTQHIYITSDEEIKEGDWVYSEQYKKILQFKLPSNKYFYKKIILTTDQDLIKNGVQPIDDEFLEWFVKNPSCESVEIEQEILKLVHNPNYVNYTPEGDGIYLTPKSENLQYGETLIEDNVIDYKIIIPT